MARTIARDHGEKRDKILTTAAKVFAAEGFDRASMRTLAEACGISKANIYHYYDTKDAILFDILDTYLRDLRDRVVGVDREGKNAEQQLRSIIVEVLLAYQGADDEHRVQTNALENLPEEQQRLLRNYQGEMVGCISAIIAEIDPAKFANDKAKLRDVTMSLFGMLNWFYMWNRDETTQARHDYGKLVGDLFLNGLGAA